MAAGLLLSRQLWLTTRLYPLTPVTNLFPPLSFPFDYVVYGAMLTLLIAIALVRKAGPLIAAFLTLAVTYALVDQSRWQPWFYLYLCLLAAIGISQQREAAANTCR